jgi:hypothetical protein
VTVWEGVKLPDELTKPLLEGVEVRENVAVGHAVAVDVMHCDRVTLPDTVLQGVGLVEEDTEEERERETVPESVGLTLLHALVLAELL